MYTGAIALIDALGFRRIWERHKPDDVLSALKAMKDRMEGRIKAQFSSQPWMQCEVAFLSDTIAISMALEEATQNRMAMSVLYLGDVISWILEDTLRSSIPMAYRGAIAIGSYEVSPHFIIGPAVDEAAATYELAQGAFIWVTPRAHAEIARWLKDQPHNTHLVKYDVPLKTGDVFRTYTVSPLEQAQNEHDAHVLARNLLTIFSDPRIDVAIKRQHTSRHLCECYKWRHFALPPELTNF